MSRFISSAVLLLVAGSIYAMERPGDSVVSGKYKTNSNFNLIPSSPIGYSTILDRVALASQKKPNTFVRYGPFVNLAKVNLDISVDRSLQLGRAHPCRYDRWAGGRRASCLHSVLRRSRAELSHPNQGNRHNFSGCYSPRSFPGRSRPSGSRRFYKT